MDILYFVPINVLKKEINDSICLLPDLTNLIVEYIRFIPNPKVWFVSSKMNKRTKQPYQPLLLPIHLACILAILECCESDYYVKKYESFVECFKSFFVSQDGLFTLTCFPSRYVSHLAYNKHMQPYGNLFTTLKGPFLISAHFSIQNVLETNSCASLLNKFNRHRFSRLSVKGPDMNSLLENIDSLRDLKSNSWLFFSKTRLHTDDYFLPEFFARALLYSQCDMHTLVRSSPILNYIHTFIQDYDKKIVSFIHSNNPKLLVDDHSPCCHTSIFYPLLFGRSSIVTVDKTKKRKNRK